MAKLIDNDFSQYEFSDEELISAASFNQLQRLYIQSEKSKAAVDKVALVFDPLNPTLFAMRVAYYDGMIAMANFLLDHPDAEAAKARWEELLEKQQQSAGPTN